MSHVRKTLADFAASIITAYESDLEDVERSFGEAETRAVTAEKELAAIQDRLGAALAQHESGALVRQVVRQVDAEARLVKEIEKVKADKQADEEALTARVQDLERDLEREVQARLATVKDHNATLVKLREAQEANAKRGPVWDEARRIVRGFQAATLRHFGHYTAHDANVSQAELDTLLEIVGEPVAARGPLLPPTTPGIVDLERAEARDAIGRAP